MRDKTRRGAKLNPSVARRKILQNLSVLMDGKQARRVVCANIRAAESCLCFVICEFETLSD